MQFITPLKFNCLKLKAYRLIRDIFNWRQLNFKGVINCITIDCHNTSKQLSYIKENLNLNFGQSENFILFSPVLFHPPSWIIVQSNDCFSIRHLEFLSNHRPSCHLELLSNQKTAFHLPSWIFDQSETCCSPPPRGIELSLLHYCSRKWKWWRLQFSNTVVIHHFILVQGIWPVFRQSMFFDYHISRNSEVPSGKAVLNKLTSPGGQEVAGETSKNLPREWSDLSWAVRQVFCDLLN